MKLSDVLVSSIVVVAFAFFFGILLGLEARAESHCRAIGPSYDYRIAPDWRIVCLPNIGPYK